MDRSPGQRAADRGLAGPAHLPRPHPGDEWRELPSGTKQETSANRQLIRRTSAVRSPVAAIPPHAAHLGVVLQFYPATALQNLSAVDTAIVNTNRGPSGFGPTTRPSFP